MQDQTDRQCSLNFGIETSREYSIRSQHDFFTGRSPFFASYNVQLRYIVTHMKSRRTTTAHHMSVNITQKIKRYLKFWALANSQIIRAKFYDWPKRSKFGLRRRQCVARAQVATDYYYLVIFGLIFFLYMSSFTHFILLILSRRSFNYFLTWTILKFSWCFISYFNCLLYSIHSFQHLYLR